MNFGELFKKYLPTIIALLAGKSAQIELTPEQPTKPIDASQDKSKLTYSLTRVHFRPDGIFSVLKDQNGNVIAHTLEHSYDNLPKIPNGTFVCVRGPHRLHNMTEDFTTFEVTGVAGHKDLLFHWGNWNRDSEGCILLGQSEELYQGVEMVTTSKPTFAKFMSGLEGVNTFLLVVS
jgi:hypothetical protein